MTTPLSLLDKSVSILFMNVLTTNNINYEMESGELLPVSGSDWLTAKQFQLSPLLGLIKRQGGDFPG